jgi:hypothetical protein
MIANALRNRASDVRGAEARLPALGSHDVLSGRDPSRRE